jgi:hypothetical protein
MSMSDWFSLMIALLSVIVAVVSLSRTRKVEAEQLKQGKVMADLAAKQIEQIEREESQKHRADLRVDLVKLGHESNFVICNRGNGTARSLTFELVECAVPPYIDVSILPLDLKPQTSVKISASIHLGCPDKYLVRIRWTEEGGSVRQEDFKTKL